MAKSTNVARYNFLCKLIADYRMEKGFSQRELSKKLGRPFTFMCKVETGIRRIDPCDLIDLCEALEIDYCMVMQQVAAFTKPEKIKRL